MLPHLIIYICAFIGIWLGSGLAINSVEKLARELKVSTFALSFLILGLFTSVSELSVGLNAVILNDPEIYVGNLIGASIVLFMLVIPLLAITGKRIHITPEFRGFNLLASLLVIAFPVLVALDGQISQFDSILAIIFYLLLMIAVESKKGILEKIKAFRPRSYIQVEKELGKILFGVIVIFLSGKFVVENTLYFSQIFKLSPFLLSVLLIGLGTNIPELSLVARSIFKKNKQIAFGNYVGSAAFNTFLLGVLTLVNRSSVVLHNNYIVCVAFLIGGLVLFYYFSRTKNAISRTEGWILFFIYLVFLLVEVLIH